MVPGRPMLRLVQRVALVVSCRPVQLFQDISGHISGPPGDRGEGPGPGDYRHGSQRQHRRHQMIPPLSRPPDGGRPLRPHVQACGVGEHWFWLGPISDTRGAKLRIRPRRVAA